MIYNYTDLKRAYLCYDIDYHTLDLKNRPLLNQNNLKSSLNQIWNDRKKMYYECAHFRIDTNGKNPDEIIQEIKIRI